MGGSTSKRLSPWARIVLASERDVGLRLSSDDVDRLIQDVAIEDRGLRDLYLAGYDKVGWVHKKVRNPQDIPLEEIKGWE